MDLYFCIVRIRNTLLLQVVDAKEVEDLLMEEDPDQGGEERVRKKLCPEERLYIVIYPLV